MQQDYALSILSVDKDILVILNSDWGTECVVYTEYKLFCGK